MKIHTLNYECVLNTTQKSAFHFHTDTRNLPLITPPWIEVTIEEMEMPMRQNSIVVLAIKRFGITTRWKMEIETLLCPIKIVDSMMSGPFRFFRHQRYFIPLTPESTLMKETISLVIPMGWLGNLFFPLLKKDMDAMFRYRHQKTKAYFLQQHPEKKS